MSALTACVVAMQALSVAPELEPILHRVSEEAETFQRLAPRVVASETLRHRSRKGAPRFRPRIADPSQRPVQAAYLEREIASEYGYSLLKEAPEAIREFRQVVAVDGRLALSMSSDDDRARRRMLTDFERHGMIGAATDFGQMLLLFRRRMLANYEFAVTGERFIGADAMTVVDWIQKGGPDALQIYQGRRLVRAKMRGQLWVRKRDSLPLRITMTTSIEEDPGLTEHAAVIDYTRTASGLLLPVSIVYTKTLGSNLMVENRYTYSEYKMFQAEAEVKFTPLDEPPPQ
jgi:hypothetical protein